MSTDALVRCMVCDVLVRVAEAFTVGHEHDAEAMERKARVAQQKYELHPQRWQPVPELSGHIGRPGPSGYEGD